MIKCVAIYPHHISDEYILKVHNTIDLACKYGFNEIFTSLHLPEYTLAEQLEAFKIICSYAKGKNLEVTADIGGPYINEILADTKKITLLSNYNFDFVRLDYGYDLKQAKALYDNLNIKGFVINASIYSHEEVKQQIYNLKSIDENIKIRACHNYYVREESGLDEAYCLKQDASFKEYNLPIYYCIPTHSNPRGPLHVGLCTLEKHRNESISEILCDLYLNYNLNAFMMADEWLNEDEFKEVDKTLKLLSEPLEKEINIEVKFLPSATEQEKAIVLQKHSFRYDSPYYFLRSQSSRQMAEFADKINKNVNVHRDAGCITIDNELYKRYSGELQVILKKCTDDEKVNVVASIVNKDDFFKLRRFREGIVYNFVEVKK